MTNATQTALDEFTRAYIEAALWSSSAELGRCDACGNDRVMTDQDSKCSVCHGKVWGTDRSFQDLGFDVSDLADETLSRMVADCERFQLENAELITDENLAHGPVPSREHEGMYGATERAGHDFWLTRNGHGAGFWDGDWCEPAATTLMNASHAYGEIDLYVGDDGKVYA